jgi:hypothetical protein
MKKIPFRLADEDGIIVVTALLIHSWRLIDIFETGSSVFSPSQPLFATLNPLPTNKAKGLLLCERKD